MRTLEQPVVRKKWQSVRWRSIVCVDEAVTKGQVKCTSLVQQATTFSGQVDCVFNREPNVSRSARGALRLSRCATEWGGDTEVAFVMI